MQRRWDAILLGWGVWLLSGCQPQAAAPVPVELPLAGQTVQVVVPSDLELRDHWEPLLQEWRAQTGGGVEWLEYDREHLPWSGAAKPEASFNGGQLILLPLAELAAAEAAGWLSPLPGAVADEVDQKDIFTGLKEAALSRQKKLIALPISAPVLLCYYRKDLLDAAGLQPPQTWDDYQQLLDELPRWAPGLTAREPCGPDFRGSLFLARSTAFAKHPQNYSAWFDIQTGEPLFHSPAFERALDTARQAWRTMPADTWRYSPADCRRELLAGRTALVLTYEPSAQYPRTASAEAGGSETPLAIGVAQLPGSTAAYQSTSKRWENVGGQTPYQPGFVGFTGLVLAVRAGNERAGAWNLLESFAQQRDIAFAERPRSACRESEANSTASASGELSPEAESLLLDATAETLRRKDVAYDLAISDAKEVRAILSAELETAQHAERSTTEILAAIQQRVAKATAGRREVLRDQYRRSVGLLPVK